MAAATISPRSRSRTPRDGRIVEFWTMNQDQAVLDLLIGS